MKVKTGYRALVVTFLALAISATGAFFPTLGHVFLSGGDFVTQLRSTYLFDQPTNRVQIALVVVDDKLDRQLPYSTPIDRQILAQLIRIADVAGARVIGVDLGIVRPTEREKDETLISTVAGARSHVVIGFSLAADNGAVGADEFRRDFLARAAQPSGFSNLSPDADGVVRHIPVAPESLGGIKSFAQLLAEADGWKGPAPQGRISWLSWTGDSGSPFVVLNGSAVLAQLDSDKRVIQPLLKDAIVIIGGANSQLKAYRIPAEIKVRELGDRLLDTKEGTVPAHAPYVHANIVAQIIDGRWIISFAPPLTFLLCFAITVAALRLNSHLHSNLARGFATFALIAALIPLDMINYYFLRAVLPLEELSLCVLLAGLIGGLRDEARNTSPPH